MPPRRRLAPLVTWLAVGALWLLTLQTDIGAGNDSLTDPGGLVGPLMDDSGEFVVAWHSWGVTHPPGYPLLNLVGNLLAQGLAAAGLAPAAAASLVSWLFALTGLALLGALVYPHDARGAATASAMLLPAFGGLVWLYASVAEVYALGIALAMALLVLALAAGARPNARAPVLALGLVFGLALGHHRTLAALLPALALAAWPARRAGWRVWAAAALLALLALGVYLYLPLAARAGSPWVYGRSPATWAGFADAVLAREYAAQLVPAAPAGIPALLAERLSYLARELGRAGLLLGLAGAALALVRPATRRPAAVLLVALAGHLFAPVSQALLIGTHLLIMVAALALAGAWGLGIAAATRERPAAAWALLGLTLLVAGQRYRAERPDILVYTQDPGGRRLIEAVRGLGEPEPTLVEAWSPRYFALAYGKWASRELAGIRLIDARADLAGLGPAEALPDTLFTSPAMLLLAPPERWAERLGPVRLESAGEGLVALRRRGAVGDGGEAVEGEAGEGRSTAVGAPGDLAPERAAIAAEAARAWWTPEGDVRLSLTWRALGRPNQDYSVFVHATDRSPIRGPDDILGQADSRHPVYGLAPTSGWLAGDSRRDDYRIPAAAWAGAGRRPDRVHFGLYTTDAEGRHAERLRQSVPIEPGE